MIIIKNKYKIDKEKVIIFLEKRDGEILETTIDIENLEKIKQYKYKWHAVWKAGVNSYYARSTKYIGIIDNKPKYEMVYLHRYILNAGDNDYIDHINHDTLDNRRCNLRITDQSKNMKNRYGLNSNNTSGERNVSWSNVEGKWLVQLQINGTNKVLRKFNYDEYDKACILAREMRESTMVNLKAMVDFYIINN